MEDVLHDNAAMRDFAGIDLGLEPASNKTTICKFRRLIEARDLREKLFAAVNEHLSTKGTKIGTGIILDATIIAAPSSTKNAGGKRDPELRQTKKSGQWYLGMKAHVGVDSKAKFVHAVMTTPANMHDSRIVPDILHGETRGRAYNACQGQRKAILSAAPCAQDFTHHRGNYASSINKQELAKNRAKSHVRAYVEHPFRILNCVLDSAKSAIAHRQEPQPAAGQLCARQFEYEAAHPDAVHDSVMSIQAAVASRNKQKHQPIQRLSPRIFKIAA